MPTIKRRIRGIRDSVPAGHVIGRMPGKAGGRPYPIKFSDLIENAYPTRSGGGGGGTASTKVIVFDGFIADLMTADEVLLQWIAPRLCRLPANLATSYAKARVAATGSTVVTLYKVVAGVATNIGTITWAGSATVATFSFAADVDFNAGDMLRAVAPASADATLKDTTIMLYGSYT